MYVHESSGLSLESMWSSPKKSTGPEVNLASPHFTGVSRGAERPPVPPHERVERSPKRITSLPSTSFPCPGSRLEYAEKAHGPLETVRPFPLCLVSLPLKLINPTTVVLGNWEGGWPSCTSKEFVRNGPLLLLHLRFFSASGLLCLSFVCIA